jgi:23S rRNA (uracil1939-C5)-methyltransferase
MKTMTEIKRGDELRLQIENSAFEGKTVSRVDGFVIFVDGAVPGDLANVRVTKVKKSFAEARVLRVEKPSELRVEPRCQYFGTCGGCKWQQVDYPAQLQFKQQHVADAFERIGGFSNLPMSPIIGADEVYFYRNKMEFSFSGQQWTDIPPQQSSAESRRPGFRYKAGFQKAELPPSEGTSSGVELPHSSYHHSPVFLGLHVPQRYDKVLDIHECHLQSESSNQILNFTREFARTNNLPVYNSDAESGFLRFLVIRQSTRTNETLVNLVTYQDQPDTMQKYAQELQSVVPSVTTVVNTINSKKAQVAYGDVKRVYLGDGVIHERLGRHLFTVSSSSFFQTNTAQAEKLYGVARSFAELKATDVVWDLYSGTGAISLFVSDAVKEVVGIESVESAVKDAERNATANKVQNCSFILGDLKDRLTSDTQWMSSRSKPDVMIIDPPRNGMHPKVIEEILQLLPPRVVYVSCNPATQARDLKILCAQQYRLAQLQPVDMFPHTYHIENVALLLRAE